MLFRTTARSQTQLSPYEAAQAALVTWGMLMLSIYVIYLLVFPLTPTIHREDHMLEIEQLLRYGRKEFAPFYVLGLLTLFYAFSRVLKTVHTLSRADPAQHSRASVGRNLSHDARDINEANASIWAPAVRYMLGGAGAGCARRATAGDGAGRRRRLRGGCARSASAEYSARDCARSPS